MAQFHEVCRVEDIQDGRAIAVEVDGLGIAIFRNGSMIHALLNRCPHQNTPMADGWVEQGEAVCPHHNWRFKLSTGRCTTVRGNTIHAFKCEIRDGAVWVMA